MEYLREFLDSKIDSELFKFRSISGKEPVAILMNGNNYKELPKFRMYQETPNTIPRYSGIPVYVNNDLSDFQIDILSYYCVECRNKGEHLNLYGERIYCNCDRGQRLKMQEDSGIDRIMIALRFKDIKLSD